jgi:hypothetical protein
MLLRTLVVIALAFSARAADIVDMSGTWQLNVAKSKWGKHPKPASIQVTIEHHEPSLKYSGTVSFLSGPSGGEETRTFAFDGAIDGKEYPVTGTLGPGKMSIRRTTPNTIRSEYRSDDGKFTQTERTTISADRKTLVNEMRENGPGGAVSWTEVYGRK